MRRRVLLCLALALAGCRRPEPVVEAGTATDGELVGCVRDEHGPVAGCRVRVRGAEPSVVTGDDGSFRLPHPTGSARVTAAKTGYFIAGEAADRTPLVLRLVRLPEGDHEDYAWVDPRPDPASPGRCGNCHAELVREWAASGHARAATGRPFRDIYGRLLAENPDGAGVCAACHAPTAGAFTDLRTVAGVAALGVHCDFCHKVADVAGGEPGLTHGHFGLKLRRPAEGQLFFGPLDDVDRGDDAHASVYRDSRYCASCHEGVVLGTHVYGTYSEWLASPARTAGRSCQSCHLPPTGPRRTDHSFFAGSREEMLRRGVRVTVDARRNANGVGVRVEVRAEEVGHRVPTGFIDRHLVLVVEARDTADQAVMQTEGPTLSELAGPTLARLPGKLYGRLPAEADEREPAPFWQATPVADTRLRPEESDRVAFRFASAAAGVRVRLLYRRFWAATAAARGWPDDTSVIVDRSVTVRR